MQAAIIVFPGSNREQDVHDALERAAGKPPLKVWHRDSELPKADLLVIPGGFSYGDYLRCGAMAAHSPITRDIIRRASNGTPAFALATTSRMIGECAAMAPHLR